jgi:hypothetical protein
MLFDRFLSFEFSAPKAVYLNFFFQTSSLFTITYYLAKSPSFSEK